MEVTRKQSLPNVPKKKTIFTLWYAHVIETVRFSLCLMIDELILKTSMKIQFILEILGIKEVVLSEIFPYVIFYFYVQIINVYKCQPEFTMLEIFTEDSVIL